MPYFDPKEVISRPTMEYLLVHSNGGISSPPSRGIDNSLEPIKTWYEARSGTNASQPDLIRVFGIDSFEKKFYRRRVGWEFRYEEVRTYFTDPRGRRRYRVKTVRKRIPIWVQAYSLVLKKKRGPTSQTSYLTPNLLDYRVGYSFLTPQNLRVSFNDVGMPVGYWSGYYDVTGPGNSKAPGYYTPVVPVGYPLVNPPYLGGPNSILSEEALRGLYNKVYSALPDYYTATAELPELVNLLKRTAIEAASLVKEIYRLDVKRLAGRLDYKVSAKDLAQLWLTYIYGVAPVLDDVADTLKFISREARTWRSYVKRESEVTTYDDWDHTPIQYSNPIRDIHTDSVSWGVIIEGRMTVSEYLYRASHWQKTAATVYEVIPFSFMLDWIADISGYLNACQIFEGLSYKAWSSYSKKREYSFSGKFVTNPDYPTMGSWSSPLFSTGYLSFSMRRDFPMALPDMPDISITKPPTDLSHLNRIINSLAILLANGDRIPKGIINKL